jgi:hypothetical protein
MMHYYFNTTCLSMGKRSSVQKEEYGVNGSIRQRSLKNHNNNVI